MSKTGTFLIVQNTVEVLDADLKRTSSITTTTLIYLGSHLIQTASITVFMSFGSINGFVRSSLTVLIFTLTSTEISTVSICSIELRLVQEKNFEYKEPNLLDLFHWRNKDPPLI